MGYSNEFANWLRATNAVRRASGVRPYGLKAGLTRWAEINR